MIVDVDRVGVDEACDAEFAVQLGLQAVDDLVGLKESEVGRDFGMQGDHDMAGAVVVDQEVVHVQNSFGVQDAIGDSGDQVRIRRLADQGTCSLHDRLKSCAQDEDRDSQTTPAIQLPAL